MDLQFEELVARVMEMSPVNRRHLAKLLADSLGVYTVRDSGESYPVWMHSSSTEAIGMTSVTVVLPDDLAMQAQAAGLLADKRLEELIRHALEQGAVRPSTGSVTPQRRRLVRKDGRLVVEALPGEQLITDTEIRGLLEKMEW